MRNLLIEDDKYLLQLMGDPWWYQIPVAPAQWEIFPSLESENSSWLQYVSTPMELYTENDMHLLAGKLIQRGTVSAAHCDYGGLLANGAASACGNLAAKFAVVEYQNRFNDQILQAAQATGVPPKLLKGLVAQESQFWDGWVIKGEYGYGMITDQGADLLLTWNLPAYLELCISVFGTTACAPGYSSLSEYQQAYLRGIALQKIGSDQEFVLLGQMLAASAGQAGQLVRNVTSKTVGSTMDYEQMWMISLAVYHGGAGCVGTALTEAWKVGDDLSWATVSEYLPGDCQLNADYPNKVLGYSN
jgi:lipid-binding SYLF domain-containing protein